MFWILGSAVGVFLGAAWTVSRPLLAQLAPSDSHGRFFGLYALADKSASIAGPLVWGIIVWALRSHPVDRYRVALAALALFVAAGWLVFRLVPDPRTRTALEETIP
jgi:UMF1 family MFS transporter